MVDIEGICKTYCITSEANFNPVNKESHTRLPRNETYEAVIDHLLAVTLVVADDCW